MIASLETNSIQIFAKSLRYLASLGNEIFLKSLPEGLVLQAVNSSKTCFCTITFTEQFFVSYKVTGDNYKDNHCVVPARPLLTIFRNVITMFNCHLMFDAKNGRLVVDIGKSKDGEMRLVIPILDYDDLQDFIPTSDLKNTLVCKPAVLIDLINNIPKGLREIAFDITKERMEIRNHINHPDKDVQTVRLKFPLFPSEFIDYEVSEDALLIVSSKDFFSILEFVDSSGDELKIVYASNGRPLVVSVEKNSTVKLQLVLATLHEDTLKNKRKPVGMTSYRALMESRLISVNAKSPEQEISDTEVHKIVSPRVSSFNSFTIGALNSAKRKSDKMTADGDSGSAELPKKQKSSETELTQKEHNVSGAIADLMLCDDDGLRGVYSETSHSSLFTVTGLKLPARAGVGTESDQFHSNTSQRLKVKRVSIPDTPLSSNSINDKNQKTKRKQSKDLLRNVKTLFGVLLKSKSCNIKMGEIFDSDENEEE